jgi:serine/threonine protein kinase
MQEISHILTLRHLYILKHFYAEDAFGRLLLAMELADCCLLDRWRRYRDSSQAFPLTELALLLRQAAEGVDYIHEKDLIHGGINPGDILLLNGQVKIADPGPPIYASNSFARVQTANLSKAVCMAPERRRGEKHLQSDQFSLAATYTWLRVGQPVLGVELDSKLEGIPALSGLPAGEREVLLKALSPDPEGRFASCIEFANALREALHDK